jgi:hypothetical protein
MASLYDWQLATVCPAAYCEAAAATTCAVFWQLVSSDLLQENEIAIAKNNTGNDFLKNEIVLIVLNIC